MKLRERKTALEQIEVLKRKIQKKAMARLFCCMQSEESNYVFSIDNLERILDKYLEQVDNLTKTFNLEKDFYLKFKKDAVEIIRDEALKRNEHEWAKYFEKKYGTWSLSKN